MRPMVKILQFISRFGALQVLAKIRMSWAHNISSELTPTKSKSVRVNSDGKSCPLNDGKC